MREQDKAVAVVCSDIHLRLKPPRARRNEPDWFKSMASVLRQIEMVAEQYRVPILCAGDVFDYWKTEPELLSFAYNYLPDMYAIPGQHDMPLHNMDAIKKSGFWTMVSAGVIAPMLNAGQPIEVGPSLVVHGFPYGTEIKPLAEDARVPGKIHAAIIHSYFWAGEHCFMGAPEAKEATAYADKIAGYDAVFFGDNHKGFLTTVGGKSAMNCGCCIRKNIDERDYRPRIGILCQSGKIMEHYLSVSDEVFTTNDVDNISGKCKTSIDTTDFVNGLWDMGRQQFDYVLAVEQAMEAKMVKSEVRAEVLKALGKGDE